MVRSNNAGKTMVRCFFYTGKKFPQTIDWGIMKKIPMLERAI